MAHELVKIALALELAVRAGRADLEHIAVGDGVFPVEDRVQRPADGLAVVNGDAAVLIDKNAQVPGPGLAHVFHIPQAAAGGLDRGGGQFGDSVSQFAQNASLRNLTKKSGQRPTLQT